MMEAQPQLLEYESSASSELNVPLMFDPPLEYNHALLGSTTEIVGPSVLLPKVMENGQSLEFTWPLGQNPSWISSQNIFIALRLALTDKAGVQYPEAKIACLADSPVTTLFSKMELLCNNAPVASYSNYHLLNKVLQIMRFDSGYKKNAAAGSAMIYRDHESFDSVTHNVGNASRVTYTAALRVADLYTQLFLPPFQTAGPLPSTPNWSIRGTLNKPEIILKIDATEPDKDIRVKILKANLHVSRLFLNNKGSKAISTYLERNDFLNYNFVDYKVLQWTLFSSALEFRSSSIALERIPSRCFIFAIEDKRANGITAYALTILTTQGLQMSLSKLHLVLLHSPTWISIRSGI
jgi:hypothetical protein